MTVAKTMIYLRCDRCNAVDDEPFEFWSLEGDEAIFAVDQAAENRGWLADGFEHFCEGCRDAHEAEQRELARERERDEWLDDPRRGQARAINAGRY